MLFKTGNKGALGTRNRVAPAGQLPSLTALRGLAALWVVLYHFSVQCLPSLNAVPHTYLIHKGYLAVDFFFMLSGFVMTHVYHRAFSQSVARHYRGFMVARVARIYPLHLMVLLLFVATVVGTQFSSGRLPHSLHDASWRGPYSVAAFVANLFMLQGLNAGEWSWNYPAWSISVEFMAYLLFPFALPLIWRASGTAKAAAGVAILGLLALLALLTRDNFDQWDGPITLLRCLPEFVLGTLLYCVYRALPRGSMVDRDWVVFGVLVLIVICLHAGAPDLLVTGLFAVLVLAAVVNTGRFSRLANVAPLIWLGEISYSLYLLHGFVQFVVDRLLSRIGIQDAANLTIERSLALLVLMVAICLIAAHTTYFSVEVGCRQYLRQLFGGRSREPVPRMVLPPRPIPAPSRAVARAASPVRPVKVDE
jgi:peptidoglycan/LPS O-acetylase OafA/YrhL